MLFQIAKWFEYVSAFAVLLPIISVIYFLIIKPGKKPLQNDITIAALYSFTSFYIQGAVLFCSLKGINNLWIFHAFISIELFFFTYLLLCFIKDKNTYLAFFLSAACYTIASTFDDPTKLPYLSVLIQFFTIIIVSPGAIMNSLIENGKTDRKFYFYRDILIKAILITSISNFVFISFIEKYLILILFIHSILNIYSNYLFARSYKCYSETVL